MRGDRTTTGPEAAARQPGKSSCLGQASDSIQLANLMIQHGVGIQTKEVIKISKIDLDFFSGGGD